MKKVLVFAFIFAMLLSACGGEDRSAEVAVIVALTQTEAALQSSQPLPTSTIEVLPPSATPETSAIEPTATTAATATVAPPTIPPAPAITGYQPFVADACNALHDAIAASIGFSGTVVSPAPFEDFIAKQNGFGCLITISQTGQYITGLDALMTPATDTMHGLGWTDDMNYGFGGPGAIGYAFRKDATLCIASFKTEEIDPALCPGGEPISMCWSRLAPEQMQYSATFNCATYSP